MILALVWYANVHGQQYVTGYTPMPEGEYDALGIAFCASFNDREIPASYVIPESYFPTPGSQGSIGSCTAWATGYAFASFYFAAKNKSGKPANYSQIMSPAFIYNDVRTCECGPYCGAVISYALNLLQNKGVVSWQNMPYSDQSCEKPTPELYAAAAKNKIGGWNRLIDRMNFNEYKEHLSNDVPIIIGVPLGGQFSGYGNKNTATPFTCTQVTAGGHAMLIVGYDDNKRAFKIMNSWGKNWGVNGFIWVDYDCFKLMMGGKGGEAYVVNKDYQLGGSETPIVKPSSNVSASSFQPYGHWEQIKTGHYYIDFGLKIDPKVQASVDKVTYVYDHASFTNKYVTVNNAPYFKTSYEGPHCLSNMQAIVYLKDGKTISVNFNGCEIIKANKTDLSTLEIQPKVTAVPNPDKQGYYNFEIQLRGVESVKNRITKVVYDYNHPTFKNRYITVTDKSNGFQTKYNGWGCLNGLGVTIYFDNNTTQTYSINMCQLLGW